MITAGDKYDLDHAFRDVVYELRAIRNSISAVSHYPEAINKCRELEVTLQAVLIEIAAMPIRTPQNGDLN